MADLSMASLGAGSESMAGIDDSAYKPANQNSSVTTKEDSEPGEMLGDLKRELGMVGVSNP